MPSDAPQRIILTALHSDVAVRFIIRLGLAVYDAADENEAAGTLAMLGITEPMQLVDAAKFYGVVEIKEPS